MKGLVTMILYRIVCWLKGDHNYSKEVLVDDQTTRNYCRCGKWLEFDWSYMGGYRKAMNGLSDLDRKRRWDN